MSSSSIPTCVPYVCRKPYTGGKCRALFIGINYYGTDAELGGCINDVSDMIKLLETMNYPLQEAVILVDDARFPGNCGMPTYENIMRAMQWLTAGAAKGDTFFIHYSGHGTQITQEMRSENESDGMDEALVPLDYEDNGLILDDTIFKYCARTVPEGARLTALLDCCHSGTLMDLPFCFTASDATTISYSPSTTNMTAGDVVMISGCQDEQTSADAVGANFKTTGTNDSRRAGGACTGALQDTIINNSAQGGRKLTFAEVMLKMRDSLKRRGFSQIPQLSCSKPIKVDTVFDFRSAITVEQLAKIENVSVEVTTTVKPTPVAAPTPAPAAGGFAAVNDDAKPAVSYTPYTLTVAWPYTVKPEPVMPATYWYYDPSLAAAAAEGAAAPAPEPIDENLFHDLPPEVAATITTIDTVEDLDEDPSDVGGKTLEQLLAEMPKPPPPPPPPAAAAAVVASEPSFAFEPLDDDEKVSVAAVKPTEWASAPIAAVKPPSYADYKRKKEEKHGKGGGKGGHQGGGGGKGGRQKHQGYGAGRIKLPLLLNGGFNHGNGKPSRGQNRMNGHGGRVPPPPSFFFSDSPQMGSGRGGGGGHGHGRGGMRGGGGGGRGGPIRFGMGRGGDNKGAGRRGLHQRMRGGGGGGRGGGKGGGRNGMVDPRRGRRDSRDSVDERTPQRGGNGGNNNNNNSPSASLALRNNGTPMKGFAKTKLSPFGKPLPNAGKPSLYDRMGTFTIPTEQDDLEELFATFDANGDGTIDREEFLDAMLQYQSQMGLELSKAQVKKDFEKADANHDGRMNFQEFSVYMLRLARQ